MDRRTFGSTALIALLLAAPVRGQQSTSETPADDARVLGAVVDESSGKPISGALVILGDGRTTDTDAKGQFSFTNVRPGSHHIAAVTRGCAVVEGGFSVQSGGDAVLRLVVDHPAERDARRRRAQGTADRVIGAEALQLLGSRSVLEAIEYHLPNLFRVDGRALALITRRGAASTSVIEPLLLLDGMRMEGMVAGALTGIRSDDLARVEVHLGNAAGWEFRPGGAPAVIEVTTRYGSHQDAQQSPKSCANLPIR